MGAAKPSFAGILALCGAMVCFVVGDVFMRLVLRDLAMTEGLLIRGVMASALVFVAVLLRGETAHLPRIGSLPSIVRSIFELIALLFFYVAMLNMPMAEANAIVQMTPLLLVLAVGLWLKEPVRPIEYALVGIGFAGTLLIVRPGASSFAPAGVLALVAACFAVGRDLMSRRVDRTIPPLVVTLTMVVVVALGMLPGALFETWRLPRAWELGYIAIAAVLIAAAHLGMYVAFRLERPPRLAPFFFLALAITIACGYFVFDEKPDGFALAGMALIGVAGVTAARSGAARG